MTRNKIPASWAKNIAPALRPLAVDLETLELDPRNARKHPDRNRDAVRASFERFGQRLPLVASGSRVLVGNLRLEVARALGWKALAVVQVPPEDAEAFAVAENRAGELAEWDDGQLAEILAELELDRDADLLAAVGFSEAELSNLLEGAAAALDDPELDRMLHEATTPAEPRDESTEPREEAPPEPLPEREPPPEPISKPGDRIQLGDHLLLCGDAFADATWDGVLGGDKRAAMVCMDPPYAIFGSSTGLGTDIADDKMVRPFFRAVGRRAFAVVRLFGHVYTFTDWRSFASLWDAYKEAQLTAKNLLVWDKGDNGLGSMYQQCHELVAFHAVQPAPRVMAGIETNRRGNQRHRLVSGSNILRFSRTTGAERPHNASKPVALLSKLIENSSEPGDLVVDLFGGGGSTLIAAERTGRRAILSEIEPGWCDVIVDRWEAETGGKAKRP